MTDQSTSILESAPPGPRSVGRPRRLTLTQILDAAIDMGLDGLRVAALAKHLNVGPAVLYTYVSGRAELIRMAAQRASGMARFPQDEGQPWREYVTHYAEAHFKLVEDGQLVSILVHGGMSPASKLDSAEQWVQVMARHGFPTEDAIDLLRAVDVIVLGGALLSTYARAVAGGEASYHDMLRSALEQRSSDDLPLLRAHAGKFAASASEGWRHALGTLLDGVENQRNSAPD